MKVRYTGPALRELAELLDYMGARSPGGAAKVLARVRQVEDHIGTFPASGTKTSDPRLLKMPTPPFPYVIFYEVRDGDVLIHRIRHGARRPVDPR